MIFYDTNALIELQEDILNEPFVVSTVSLMEIEAIKVAKNKDEELKAKCRKLIHILDENTDKYDVIIYTTDIEEKYLKTLELSPDNKICACAKWCEDAYDIKLDFITEDICCRTIAREVFQLNARGINKQEEEYVGYKEVELNEEDMAYFYEHMTENIYNLLINEYLIIKDTNGEVVDKYKWTEEGHKALKASSFKSDWFGTIKPYNGDIYQQLAVDMLQTNKISMIKGVAGSGKSYLALGYLFSLLDKRKIDKIIMFANPTPTANSAKLGFLPGSQFEKLVDSSVGNMLEGKLGSKYGVEQLVSEGKLSILPMCDIRGYDTTGQRAGIYVTEAQNMDVSLMKLALQRIGEDCICILDGDYNTQVDLGQYSGSKNGMRRASEVFRGHECYGEVQLNRVYRSEIAAIAELM